MCLRLLLRLYACKRMLACVCCVLRVCFGVSMYACSCVHVCVYVCLCMVGRCAVFPNLYQHKVEPFQLQDPTQVMALTVCADTRMYVLSVYVYVPTPKIEHYQTLTLTFTLTLTLTLMLSLSLTLT